MYALKCISMQYHAACEECNRMECNENVENASESRMHKTAQECVWEESTPLSGRNNNNPLPACIRMVSHMPQPERPFPLAVADSLFTR